MHSNSIVPVCLVIAIGLITSTQASAQDAPNSFSPGKGPGHRDETESMLPTTKSSPKKKHKKSFFSPSRSAAYRKPKVEHTARYEFYERIEQAAKEKQRILKKMSKAQYSDPRYFGHKRIPKRRSPHKMRYCGECGIRH